MTADERTQLVEAVADQVVELARARNLPPDEILADMRKHLLVQRFRNFVSRNQAMVERQSWEQSDVAAWIESDRLEQRGR